MTNREIKLELAKVALARCSYTDVNAFNEAIRNLYEWIVEEPEVVVEQTEKDDKNPSIEYDNKPISEVISCISKSGQMGSTYATKLCCFCSYNKRKDYGNS